MKKGFTLIEMLTSGLILVIAMGLIAILYSKAAKIRTIINNENDIQGVANQMMDTIISGGGNPLEGLRCATKIYSTGDGATAFRIRDITFGNIDGQYVRIKIDPATDKTVKKETGAVAPAFVSNDLDFNDKINIVNTPTNNSRFCFYDQNDDEITLTTPDGTDAERNKIAKIMICLVAKSSLSATSRTIILYNSITIRNIYHID